jgi:hypothetical protein
VPSGQRQYGAIPRSDPAAVPDLERPSYVGARVEVQERMDGSLLVRHQGKFLTPRDAPPLATQLRAQVAVHLPSRSHQREATATSQSPGNSRTPGWRSDLVRGSHQKATPPGPSVGWDGPGRQQGKRIGPEGISRSQAARELGAGYNTLKRL